MRRILCYGDSNTFGTGPMATLADDPILSKAERWAGVMAADLGDGWDVVVEGLPGRTTVFDDPVEGEYRNGFRSFRAILESHRPIDLLIVMLGTNDLKQRFNLGPQDVALGVARLLIEARKLEIVDRMLVISPAPVRERGDLAEIFRGAEARAVGLSDQMARFAGENGAAFLDAGAHIAVDEADGVHLSSESHAILGRVVAGKVRDIFA
ncbi:MAG: GDSL family lipase [Silicimonas sp.]|nr:GDSL family lipase [Silicimonas sp.]RZW08403.1 MAG: GDSL family lipase [Paracoccaceae bacterium]